MSLHDLYRMNPGTENSIAQAATIAAAFGKAVVIICADQGDARRQFQMAACHARDLYAADRIRSGNGMERIEFTSGGRLFFISQRSEVKMRGLRVDLILRSDW